MHPYLFNEPLPEHAQENTLAKVQVFCQYDYPADQAMMDLFRLQKSSLGTYYFETPQGLAKHSF